MTSDNIYTEWLEAEGFTEYHTGGNCMVMFKPMEKDGRYIWVTAADGGDLPDPEFGFMACLYPQDDDYQHDPIAQFCSDDDEISLRDAILALTERANDA